MNWATMSKYDILQKVILGGNATSKQGNTHTLVSISGDWDTPKTYSDCTFAVNSGNLVISGDSCDISSEGEGTATCPNPTDDPTDFPDSKGSGRNDKAPSITAPTGNSSLDATIESCYSFNFGAKWGTITDAANGTATYTWSITSGSLPAGLSLHGASGTIYGTPEAGAVSSTFTIQVADSDGRTDSKSVTLEPVVGTTTESRYNVKVDLDEETFTDQNGNGIYDPGYTHPDTGTAETFTDSNGNGSWDGKKGIFQQFWDDHRPRARWGLTNFSKAGGAVLDQCIPAGTASSFFTRVQNATPADVSPLATALRADVSYFGFDSPYDANFTGCDSDPYDADVPCRKNYVLVISSGGNVGGDVFDPAQADCPTVPNGNSAENLVKNACTGFNNLNDWPTGKQNVYTFVVNTLGTNATNNGILEDAATAGGGKYYQPSSAGDLGEKLTQALNDILDQAASGTAVSVLTTSSRGVGSMVQAYFLPKKLQGTRDVYWTGYLQNLWIDPQDNLREDRTQDFTLKLGPANDSTADRVLRLYFDESAKETKARLFTTDAEGEGGGLATCTPSGSAIPFSEISYLWEAGTKLATKNPSARKLFTSKKILHGGDETYSFLPTYPAGTPIYPEFKTGMHADLLAALDAPGGSFTAENIVRYIRGVCLETGRTDDTACTDAENGNGIFRDRRILVGGGQKVWKFGDVISSTPKVFSGSPNNTYHLDYGDNTYYSYISSSTYKDKSSIAFVGANDGLLHAFRVGYLNDTNPGAGAKAKFQNTSATTATENLGEEVWGFIPFSAFPYLKYLADPEYGNCHIYFNDLSVRLVDASLGDDDDPDHDDPTENRTVDSWRTILVGGMRFGGACAGSILPSPPSITGVDDAGYSSYYAIDITDPENPVPLWEFSDPDMGYATTFASIVRTGNKAHNGAWYAVFGSGSTQLPRSGLTARDIGRSTTGYIYFVNLKTGALVKKIGLGHAAIVGDVLAIDEDKDYLSEKIYFGTSYKSGADWAGKLMSLAVPSDLTTLCGSSDVNREYSDCTASTPVPVKIHFSGNYPFTASPDATRDPDGNIWIYAGSGKYFSDLDDEDTSGQVMIGLKDSAVNKVAPDLYDANSHSTEGTVTGTSSACMYNSVNNDFEEMTFVTSINPTTTADPQSVGWRIDLSGGERVITRPLAVGGLVDFLTYKPASDACSYGGDSYLYAVDYLSGTAPSGVAIRAPEVTGGTTGMGDTVTVAKGILLGPGAPPTGEAIIIPPPKEGQEQLKKKIQIATGVIVEAENTPVLSVISKVLHWLRK
jgi:type IV pilus assembly protein PilY1